MATHDERRMEVRAIRFGATQWQLIEAQAKLEGVSSSQFVRDSAYARAIILWAHNHPEARDPLIAILAGHDRDEIAALLQALLDAYHVGERHV